jgi:cystathionine gamma-synthase
MRGTGIFSLSGIRMSISEHLQTLALHGGAGETRSVQPVGSSIVTSTSFHTHPDQSGFSANDSEEGAPFFYTRWSNPTIAELEDRLAAIESGAKAIVFASGMAAISGLFLTVLKAGDHLVISDVCYAGTAEFAHQVLTRYGIEVTAVDTTDVKAVAEAIRPGVTKLLHIETPANPTLALTDIRAMAQLAYRAGCALSVDSTIATPLATRPIELGADYVVHSLSKYICGHGDALGGAIIVAKSDLSRPLRQHALIHHGGAMSPFSAWLILRGMETLPIRMRAHEKSARQIAQFLQSHEKVKSVLWPGLSDHPQATLASSQMDLFPGVLSFTTKVVGMQFVRRVAERIKLTSYAVSIGKTKSLLFYIPTDDIFRTSFQMSINRQEAYRNIAGEGIFRLSVGLENASDIISDLANALG